MLTGLTSITFRQLTVDEIIALVKKSGLDGIEWGGDVHVPPASPELAAEVAKKCADAGVKVLSYGSYWKCTDIESFDGVLESAKALGAPIIRIWVGTLSPDKADDAEFARIVGVIRAAAKKAAAEGVGIAFEYHRNTLTQTLESAVRLLDAIPEENVTTYWQPNPDITFEEQLREIDAVAPRLSYLHAFAWEVGNVRYPLSHAAAKWTAYFDHAKKAPGSDSRAVLIEFVVGDKPEQYLEDAKTLKELTKAL